MYRVLLTLAWLLAVGYSQVPTFWFLAHPFAERWRSRPRSPYRVLVPIWLAEMLGVAALTWRWREVALYSAPYAWIPAVLLIATGLGLYHGAHQGFTHAQIVGRSEVETGQAQRLVTGGLRARVRHPLYLGHLCGLLGWALGSGLLVIYILLAYALIGFAITIPLEDAELERRFGDAYRQYRRTVPAILPHAGTR